jgi:hypothetical protein
MFAGICAAIVLALFLLTFSDKQNAAVVSAGAKEPPMTYRSDLH